MTLQAYEKLILLCARTELDQSTRGQMDAVLSGGVEWNLLIKRATQLELMPLVSYHLRKSYASLVPENIYEQLTQQYYQNLTRNLLLSEELAAMMNLVEDQGMPIIPVKGIILSETVFGNPGLRQMCDLDVLIRREHVARAVELLKSRGFDLIGRLPSGADDFERRRDATLVRTVGKMPIVVEMQWKFKDTFFRLPEEAMWSHLTEYSWKGKRIRIFSPELTLLHLVHHLNYHAYPLKILIDIAETLRAYNDVLNWDKLWRMAVQWKLARNTCVAFECVRHVLHGPVPDSVLAEARRLGGKRVWLTPVTCREEWFFSQRAAMIQSQGHLRTAFSVLFLDGTMFSLLQTLFRRALGTKARVGLKPLRNLVGFLSGLLKLLILRRKRSSMEEAGET